MPENDGARCRREAAYAHHAAYENGSRLENVRSTIDDNEHCQRIVLSLRALRANQKPASGTLAGRDCEELADVNHSKSRLIVVVRGIGVT